MKSSIRPNTAAPAQPRAPKITTISAVKSGIGKRSVTRTLESITMFRTPRYSLYSSLVS